MDTERIAELLEKSRLTAKDKEEIRAAADDAGIEYHIRRGCNDACYEKLLLALYDIAAMDERAVSVDGYRLKSATTKFMLLGKMYGNHNIKDVKVGDFNPLVRQTFFEKVRDDGQDSEV